MIPGAYLLNGNYGCYPIFFSLDKLSTTTTIYMNNTADGVMVLPGFKLQLWEGNIYTGTGTEFDNRTGTKGVKKWDFGDVSVGYNTVSSLKLWRGDTATEAVELVGTSTGTGTLTVDRPLFTRANQIPFPPAYLVNGLYGVFPIFYSLKNFGYRDGALTANGSVNGSSQGGAGPWMENVGDVLILMPGYKIKIYIDADYGANTNHTSYDQEHTNTTTVAMFCDTHNNNPESCKLYYGDAGGYTEILHITHNGYNYSVA